MQIKENIAPISLFGRREGEIPNKIGKKCTLGLKQGLKLISTKFDANLGFILFYFFPDYLEPVTPIAVCIAATNIFQPHAFNAE